MDLSVIIPARNEERLLANQLGALTAQDWDGEWEIIVVDNQSTDGTAGIVHEWSARHPRIRLAAAHERAGLAYTRNVGARAANGRTIAFCDADDVVGDGWVAAVGNAAAQHSFLTGTLELGHLNPPHLADSRGRDDEHRAPTFYGLFPSAHGNNFAVRRELWDKVGGSDETIIKASCEDVELSLRLWLDGVPLFFEPAAVVHYRYRDRPSDLFRQGKAYGECRPLVARRLLEATGLRPARMAGWRSWAWLVAHLPDAARPERRPAWVWVAGNRWGHVLGSARHRVLLL